MNRRAPLYFVAAIALATSMGGASAPPPEDLPREAERHFARGGELLESNCAECYRATRQGLDEAIQELNAALTAGYRDPVEIYRRLADAYGQIAWGYAVSGSAEQQDAERRQLDALARLVELAPRDADALYDYAMLTPDLSLRRERLAQAVEAAPDFAAARFELGETFLEKGDISRGLAEMRQGFERAHGEQAIELGERLARTFAERGRAADARAISARLKQLRREMQSDSPNRSEIEDPR